jgi:hypothetical protein
MKAIAITITAAARLCFSIQVTAAESTPYKGTGGLIEAFGNVATVFYGSWQLAEGCKRFPKLASRAETSKLRYASVNQPVFEMVIRAMDKVALMNGGPGELERLKKEVQAAKPQIDSAVKAANLEVAYDERSCNLALSLLNSGASDLRVRTSKDVAQIYRAVGMTR